jgi:predicted secreted protein
MKIRFTLLIILIAGCISTNAQLAMGKWRTHLAYNNVSKLAQSSNKIYAVGNGSMFSYDKLDGGVEFYSKITGLNGSNISQIAFDQTTNQLLVVYADGNIDVMGRGGVTNIPDLSIKQMNSSKDVNQIFLFQDKAYFACNFGIMVMNLSKLEIADTYIIGPNATEVKVVSTTINNGTIYAATPTTLYKASASSSQLVNYQNWSTESNLPGSGNLQAVVSFQNQLVLLRGGQLFKKDVSQNWSSLLSSTSVTNIKVTGNILLASDASSVYVIDNSFNSKAISVNSVTKDFEFDQVSNTFWLGGASLSTFKDGETPKSLPIDGPAVNSPWSMTFAGKKLFVVPGGRWDIPKGNPATIMIFENGEWTNLPSTSFQSQLGILVRDYVNVVVDPIDNKHFFVTSYGNGLFEYKNNAFSKWYNHENTTNGLESYYPSGNERFYYIRLYGTTFDKSGNLWVASSTELGSNATVRVLLSNGNWVRLPYPQEIAPTIGPILISNQNQNQKWVLSARENPGVIVFDDNGTITDTKDDKSIFMKSFIDLDKPGSSFTPNTYYCIAQDKNGVIWVGTEQGPLLFTGLSKMFTAGYTCSRVKIPRNDGTSLADYLLGNEGITAISIDGANRKWIGTKTSGVYLLSEDGLKTISHFTTSNSPLLSNSVLSIAINPITGEVFFGTDLGLISYQGDAADATGTFGDVHAYPNPVRENFTGVITITGLIEDTQVKITDLTGNLVCQTVSNGSIATWDGKDGHGRKVNTGVYIALCVSPDGTQSTTTKILVIN